MAWLPGKVAQLPAELYSGIRGGCGLCRGGQWGHVLVMVMVMALCRSRKLR